MILNLLLRLLLLLGGGDLKMAIVTVYTTLILAGRRTFEQVPVNLKAFVEEDLAAMGLDTTGQPLA